MAMNILIVDDDQLARQRMRQMLMRCGTGLCGVVEEAADTGRATGLMRHRRFDLLLLDVQMPGQDGLELASSLRYWTPKPAVVFVTGHSQHALQAFEADAVDYLTKPVRPERLERALHKAASLCRTPDMPIEEVEESLRVVNRGRAQRLPLSEVLFLRAQDKRLLAVTSRGSFMLDGSLVELEKRQPGHWLRVHRHTLAARHAVQSLHRSATENEEVSGWHLSLRGTAERLQVARRMLGDVRSQLGLRPN
ncbi:response regulator [Xylophilus rhododendri]|uniref:Response regulator n=1 Tax=Xylophilus rhododendri TaxID=2697032 RepID=A0A857J9Y1_9BURK|nr:LytTR family DNA-binding domain-containing protein [Xylophilus rhododendri]QHJ00538.1 response regulator [Xylophilus rhododendri]